VRRALGNGIFDAATNRTRMETQYKSALQKRINWDQLETEALHELRSGQPMQVRAILCAREHDVRPCAPLAYQIAPCARLSAVFESALIIRVSPRCTQSSTSATSAGAFGAKLDRMLTSSNAARAREAHDRQHTLLQERINRSLSALKRAGPSGAGNVLGGAAAATPMERTMSRQNSIIIKMVDSSSMSASQATRRLARQATALSGSSGRITP
jgi:hypothetical protein